MVFIPESGAMNTFFGDILMKNTIPLTSLILFMMASTVIAQESEPPASYQIGNATLYRIEDTASGFSADVFPTVEKATFDKYATDGKIPSSVSAFLLKVPDKRRNSANEPESDYILIDAGMGAPNGKLFANLGKAMPGGYQPEKIIVVWITHSHGDHIGGLLNGDARRFPKAKVLCSKLEYEHWNKQNNAALERIKKVYGDDFRAVDTFDEAMIVTNADHPEVITPLNAVGHTPGHTVFLIESEGEKLMVVGDLLHAAALQFPVPEACARYDMDQAEAVQARRRILDKAAGENIPVAGIHFPNPGIGFVKKNANGGYDFTPIRLSPEK